MEKNCIQQDIIMEMLSKRCHPLETDFPVLLMYDISYALPIKSYANRLIFFYGSKFTLEEHFHRDSCTGMAIFPVPQGSCHNFWMHFRTLRKQPILWSKLTEWTCWWRTALFATGPVAVKVSRFQWTQFQLKMIHIEWSGIMSDDIIR